MSFEPTDYLTGLNFDFDQPIVSPGHIQQTDLDLFGNNDFLDFDVLATGAVPVKPAAPEFTAPIKQETQTVAPQPKSAPVDASNEDKRKRNTAASARFRIKKKMKEQEMEQRSKDLQDKMVALEKKLKQLEMENKCLKNLILQRNERKNTDLLEEIKKRSILDSKPMFTYTS
ncbi:hypothetical protein DICA3_E14642 [Diutina catenulata]